MLGAGSETSGNIDRRVVEGFGQEWSAYDQTSLDAREFKALYDSYFSIFPFEDLPNHAEGFDLGCGSGRWAAGVVTRPEIGKLHCIDPSAAAVAVARRRLAAEPKASFHVAAADTIPLPDGSQD